MTITTNHSSSAHGVPIILDDVGQLLDYAEGLTMSLKVLGWSRKDLAENTNKSLRTVEGWWQGRQIPADALNVLADALGQRTKTN